MNVKDINQLAVWLPMRGSELHIKVFEDYHYKYKGIVRSASTLKPVIRYAKNYEQNGKRFSLCIISLEKKADKIEEWLDKQAKQIDIKKINKKFELLNVYYKD